jgi:hypothetical protein
MSLVYTHVTHRFTQKNYIADETLLSQKEEAVGTSTVRIERIIDSNSISFRGSNDSMVRSNVWK